MTLHELKCWPGYFEAIKSGAKNFEVRRDDRRFAVGDALLLREWDPDTQSYSGRELSRWVTYVMHGMGQVGVVGPARGISLHYVVLALTDSLEVALNVEHNAGGAKSGDVSDATPQLSWL